MKILIAEDEIGIAETYEMILVAKGHGVTLTTDGAECVKIYKDRAAQLVDNSKEYLSKNPPFDVVVLDYRLPSMDGMEVAKQILAENPSQRIIFASAYVTETLAEWVRQLNQVVELLHKPFELELLLYAIQENNANHELKKIKDVGKELEEAIQVEQLRELLKELKLRKAYLPLAPLNR